MKIQVSYEDNWYTAVIAEYGIVTQGKTFDELIYMINDALECYFGSKDYDVEVSIPNIHFNFGKLHHASKLQAS